MTNFTPMSTSTSRRDSSVLSFLVNEQFKPAKVVNPDAEKLVDSLFKSLKLVFPASVSATFKNPSDEVAAKRQWVIAFVENGIKTRKQVSLGMKQARASESPFWPSPGKFIGWCKTEQWKINGLPSIDGLFDMVMDYSARRGFYDSAEEFPWKDNACYWMVPRLYDLMRSLNLSELDLRKRCEEELVAMSNRIDEGQTIPAPVRQIKQSYTPVSRERGIEILEKIKKEILRK